MGAAHLGGTLVVIFGPVRLFRNQMDLLETQNADFLIGAWLTLAAPRIDRQVRQRPGLLEGRFKCTQDGEASLATCCQTFLTFFGVQIESKCGSNVTWAGAFCKSCADTNSLSSPSSRVCSCFFWKTPRVLGLFGFPLARSGVPARNGACKARLLAQNNTTPSWLPMPPVFLCQAFPCFAYHRLGQVSSEFPL